MPADRIYLDNNATTRPLPQVRGAMLEILENSFANPSSAHSLGRLSRKRVVAAREQVASLAGALPEQLIFTSGGTEANNQVFLSCTHRQRNPHIITTVVEHSSILKTCAYLENEGLAEVTYLPVGADGIVSPESLREALLENTVLVSIQWANNETGIVQDIPAIQAVCKDAGVLFHTDAAQAIGKINMDFASMSADFITFTAHKIHGPQGVGAIVCRDIDKLSALLHGGSQEMGLRPGTENVPGIVGFGVAAELRHQNLETVVAQLEELRGLFEREIVSSLEYISVNGDSAHRVCNTSNLQFSGVEGLALFAQLDARGLVCSQSSACTNQRPEPSYVLSAMGLSEDEAYASVRFCFSQENTKDEVQRAISLITEICDGLK